MMKEYQVMYKNGKNYGQVQIITQVDLDPITLQEEIRGGFEADDMRGDFICYVNEPIKYTGEYDDYVDLPIEDHGGNDAGVIQVRRFKDVF